MTHRDAGTPWLAREATEVLAMLDTPASVAVHGLLDECPVLPAAVPALLDGSAKSVSATQFEFIASTAQIRLVHTFMAKLPDLLLG